MQSKYINELTPNILRFFPTLKRGSKSTKVTSFHTCVAYQKKIQHKQAQTLFKCPRRCRIQHNKSKQIRFLKVINNIFYIGLQMATIIAFRVARLNILVIGQNTSWDSIYFATQMQKGLADYFLLNNYKNAQLLRIIFFPLISYHEKQSYLWNKIIS